MRRSPAPVRLALTLAAALAAAVPWASPVEAGGGRVAVDPRFPPLHRSSPGDRAGRGFGSAVPRAVLPRGAYGRGYGGDGYGYDRRRQQGYVYGPGQGYGYGQGGYGQGYGYGGPRPPGWADDLPGRAQAPGRFVRPSPGVVCDQSTALCYRRGEVDKSETRDVFGGRAAGRADDLRDERGTARLFAPERGVACDPARRVCYDDGRADFSLTRRYFGQRAAGALDY